MQMFTRRRSQPTVALGGAGYIATLHAVAARAAGMRVVAVASRGGVSARHLAGELDAKRCKPDDLPAGADVLVVAAPPSAHVELALRGLSAGALVLVEKPLATTLADADRLVDAPGAASRLRCGENLLHAPFWDAAMGVRRQLGQLTHLSLRTLQPAPTWGHFAEPLDAGGTLFDLGPHAIAVAMGLAGEAVTSVSARLSTTRSDGADDEAHLRLDFDSGLAADVTVAWTGEDVTWDAQAASATGVLRLELLPQVALEHNGEPVAIPRRHPDVDPALEQFGYVDQLLDLAGPESGRRGQGAAAAREVLEVIVAAYASAGNDGAAVSLPFTGDRSATPRALWGR